VEGIDDKRPAVIAIAVAAELLQQYEANQKRSSESQDAQHRKIGERRSAMR